MSGKHPEACKTCKYAAEEYELRKSYCERCGAMKNTVSPMILHDLNDCNLRMIGGERLDHLPKYYYTAIGTMRMIMISNLIDSTINKALNRAFGSGQ